jgi:hypothetical protein
LDHVPGTVLLDDETTVANTTGLKHGKGRNAHIVLSPQPSNDPNDPLNWSAFKKELIIVILSLGAMLNAGVNVSFLVLLRDLSNMLNQGPLLNASYFALSQQLDTTITTVVLASGYNLLAAGCIGPFGECL